MAELAGAMSLLTKGTESRSSDCCLMSGCQTSWQWWNKTRVNQRTGVWISMMHFQVQAELQDAQARTKGEG